MTTPDIKASKLDSIQRTFSGNKPYFISLRLNFDRQPDLTRLQKALTLLTESIPILSADFDNVSGGWIFTDKKIEITKFSGSENDTVAYFNSDLTALFCVMYIAESNTLIITIDHTITDAHGLLQISKIFCTAYRELEKNTEYIIPEINTKRVIPLTKMMTGFSEKNCTDLCRLEIKSCETAEGWQKYLTTLEPAGEKYQFHIRRIPAGKFIRAKSYAKKHGATINDLLKTAFALSIQKLVRERFGATISVVPVRQANDLRRCLPENIQANIGNFSVPCQTSVACTYSDFSVILENTSKDSRRLKENPTAPGVLFAVEYPDNPVSQMLIKNESLQSAALSNTGVITPEAVDFGGELKVTEALLYSDFRFGNPYYLIASTYDNTLSLVIITKSAGEAEADFTLDEIQRIIQDLSIAVK